MPFRRFIALSTIGSRPWCLALAYIGMVMGENWQAVETLYRPLEYIVVIGAVALLAHYVLRWRTTRKACGP